MVCVGEDKFFSNGLDLKWLAAHSDRAEEFMLMYMLVNAQHNFLNALMSESVGVASISFCIGTNGSSVEWALLCGRIPICYGA